MKVHDNSDILGLFPAIVHHAMNTKTCRMDDIIELVQALVKTVAVLMVGSETARSCALIILGNCHFAVVVGIEKYIY